MILLLDNYDSFVHNLARYFRRLGCRTRVIRSDQIDAATCAGLAPDAVVISPGPRRPAEAGCSVEVVERLSPQIPILGVCLGHQAIGVALGGVVTRCGPIHGMASTITHNRQDIFAGCRSPLRVGRYHSLAIDPERLPSELEVTAKSDDGVIMGVRHRTRPVFGVQFHPESVLTEDGLVMLRNFVGITQSQTERGFDWGRNRLVILESIVTSVDARGQINIAPMGPRMDADNDAADAQDMTIVLRPFKSSRTYSNLVETRKAVIHVTDDAELLARAAVNAIHPDEIDGLVRQIDDTHWWALRDCHKWFAVEVESISSDQPRADMQCRVVRSETLRPFFGFNRAKHAVIEAAILATRTHLLPPQQIRDQLDRLQPLIDKTGGPAEHRAFDFLRKTIDDRLASR